MIKTFIEAFRANHSGFIGDCNCGRTYYNPESCWDYDDNEIAHYKEDSNCTELLHSVQYVEFDRREYVIDCDCWHDKVNRFMSVIDEHDRQIAIYLNKERERKIFEAEQVQIVNILSTTTDSAQEFDDDIPF